MSGAEDGVREVYVLPGESHLVAEPSILRTVLGSCVGITFRIPRLGAAALCHPMLPVFPAAKGDASVGLRYVDFAIRDLMQRFDALGADRAEIEVKLFGGGDVLPVGEGGGRATVGKLNCDSALKVLREERLEVAASSLGGSSGINLQFHTLSGAVFLRRLAGSRNPAEAATSSGRQTRANRTWEDV
jgi:chemotaxis protein CheD